METKRTTWSSAVNCRIALWELLLPDQYLLLSQRLCAFILGSDRALLIAISLQAGAAVREFPAARDDDHPDEVERGDDPGGSEHGKKMRAANIHEKDGRKDD